MRLKRMHVLLKFKRSVPFRMNSSDAPKQSSLREISFNWMDWFVSSAISCNANSDGFVDTESLGPLSRWKWNMIRKEIPVIITTARRLSIKRVDIESNHDKKKKTEVRIKLQLRVRGQYGFAQSQTIIKIVINLWKMVNSIIIPIEICFTWWPWWSKTYLMSDNNPVLNHESLAYLNHDAFLKVNTSITGNQFPSQNARTNKETNERQTSWHFPTLRCASGSPELDKSITTNIIIIIIHTEKSQKIRGAVRCGKKKKGRPHHKTTSFIQWTLETMLSRLTSTAHCPAPLTFIPLAVSISNAHRKEHNLIHKTPTAIVIAIASHHNAARLVPEIGRILCSRALLSRLMCRHHHSYCLARFRRRRAVPTALLTA